MEKGLSSDVPGVPKAAAPHHRMAGEVPKDAPHTQAASASAIDGSPQVQAQFKLAQEMQNSPGMQAQRQLASEINEGRTAAAECQSRSLPPREHQGANPYPKNLRLFTSFACLDFPPAAAS